MFDLFRSRDKAVRILLGALLVMVAISMLTYLVPNYSSGSSTTDTVLAEVGKDVITLNDAQRLVQTTVRNRQLPPEVLPNYIPQMVDQLVTERAMAYQLDGLSAKEPVSGGVGATNRVVTSSIDAISEVKAYATGMPAEFGR